MNKRSIFALYYDPSNSSRAAKILAFEPPVFDFGFLRVSKPVLERSGGWLKRFGCGSATLCILCVAMLCPVVSRAATVEILQRSTREVPRTLIGRVHGSQERPIADAVVYLKNTKTLVVKTYITEENGAYRFPALAPNVDYEVHAEYKGARSDTKTLSSFDSRKEAIINLKINGK